MYTIEVYKSKAYRASGRTARTRGTAFFHLSRVSGTARVKDAEGNVIAKRVNGKLSLV